MLCEYQFFYVYLNVCSIPFNCLLECQFWILLKKKKIGYLHEILGLIFLVRPGKMTVCLPRLQLVSTVDSGMFRPPPFGRKQGKTIPGNYDTRESFLFFFRFNYTCGLATAPIAEVGVYVQIKLTSSDSVLREKELFSRLFLCACGYRKLIIKGR